MNKELKWSFYFEVYAKKYRKFYQQYTKLIENGLKNISENDLINIGQLYIEVFNSLINVCKYFLWNNTVFIEETREVVIYFLSCGISDINFYKLYYKISKLKEDSVIPNKYFQKKYLNIFITFNNFFQERIQKEADYDLDF